MNSWFIEIFPSSRPICTWRRSAWRTTRATLTSFARWQIKLAKDQFKFMYFTGFGFNEIDIVHVWTQVEQDLAMGTDAEGEFCLCPSQREYHVNIFVLSHFCVFLHFLFLWVLKFCRFPGEKIRDHMRNIVPILLDQNVTINDKIRFETQIRGKILLDQNITRWSMLNF